MRYWGLGVLLEVQSPENWNVVESVEQFVSGLRMGRDKYISSLTKFTAFLFEDEWQILSRYGMNGSPRLGIENAVLRGTTLNEVGQTLGRE